MGHWPVSPCSEKMMLTTVVVIIILPLPFYGHYTGQPVLYTLNHKKRDILFLTITLANINRFL